MRMPLAFQIIDWHDSDLAKDRLPHFQTLQPASCGVCSFTGRLPAPAVHGSAKMRFAEPGGNGSRERVQ